MWFLSIASDNGKAVMEPFFYKSSIIPDGFVFPHSYESVVMSGSWPQIEPWAPLAMDMPSSLFYYGAMLLKFRKAPLIPFSIIRDESGFYNSGYVVLACFDGCELTGEPTVRIYDYGKPKVSPWNNVSYPSFLVWLEAAKMESKLYRA